MFRVAPSLDLKKLEAIFRHKVFKMLLAKGRITKDLIDMLSSRCHSGFQVFCGQRLFPQDETAMENLARSILRASFSQERVQDLAEPSKVVYRAKDGTEEKVFDALSGRPPCVPTSRTGGRRWSGTKDSATLSELTVQMVFLTPILNRPLCTPHSCHGIHSEKLTLLTISPDFLDGPCDSHGADSYCRANSPTIPSIAT
jgi:hypothetical protein